MEQAWQSLLPFLDLTNPLILFLYFPSVYFLTAMSDMDDDVMETFTGTNIFIKCTMDFDHILARFSGQKDFWRRNLPLCRKVTFKRHTQG